MRQTSIIRNMLMGIALVVTVAACEATSGRETAGEYIDDSAITTKIKSAYLNEPAMKSMQIDVTTFKNVVQLSGFVDKTETKVLAGQIARTTKGVHDVQNDLIIR